ncbi:Uncharacterized protein Adt_28385 [Abeliophyllum distichum]|uniref:Retrotransposon gag domain-containing protein n=1 Tax=Abeliophyllum distichum TaxID=126358 RepID=A0ABD1RYM0_9LAMI
MRSMAKVLGYVTLSRLLRKKVKTVEANICKLNIQLDESRMMCAAMTDAIALLSDLQEEMEAMRLQLLILLRVVGNRQTSAQEYALRLKIPEPRTYGGAHDVKEVENFFFDMEQYSFVANIENGAKRVTIATMYRDAKLWWCTKYADIQVNRSRWTRWISLRNRLEHIFFQKMWNIRPDGHYEN